MNVHAADTSPLIYARVAGVLYLIIIVCGIYSEAYVRASLIVSGDAAATSANILAAEGLFRSGFVADTIMLFSDVAIAIMFYVLLRPVSNSLALIVTVFRLTQAAILGFNLLNYHAALLLLTGPGYMTAFTPDQLNEQAMLFLDMHSHGYDLALLFFSFSSFILGYLVIKSDFFPGILGYGLIAAAAVYLSGGFAHFLFPDDLPLIEPFYIVPLIAELSFCLWLLIKGVRTAS